ncbi:kinesin-like protein KIF23 [Amanita muscaria]
MATKGTTTRASSRAKAAATASVTADSTTRATRSRNVASTTKATGTYAPTKKAAARKPLANKTSENEVEVASKSISKPSSQKTAKPIDLSTFTDREPIMAYLRIRPCLNDDNIVTAPYLTSLSDTTVRMADPQESQASARYRVSTVPPSSLYTFSHVFPQNSTQSEFFTKTTLPLVRDVLMGQSGLLFTYGVTNSGKTYTIQGSTAPGSAGILPRTLDVLFNSIESLHAEGKYRPVRLYGVEAADPSDFLPQEVMPAPVIAEMLGPEIDIAAPDLDIDPTIISVDRNYEYSVWLSYAEVYNEKIYDLLDCVKGDSMKLTGDAVGMNRKSLVLTRKALALKSSPAADAADSGATGKYIAGLKQFRIHNAAQAKALVKLGQLHRRVFGTLANRESSRSHGMVVIKVMRCHRGDRDDPSCLQTARLTLVDLAGSERTKHTQTTGERLKEAGNINKSLMVLGQCMEVMRNNQRKLASSLSQTLRMDTKEVKKGLAVVPFRHSKLTEALMDYFTGDGRTVMIVNVNPFDTGYDENSHVMRFAALAREVYISPTPAPVQRMPLSPKKAQGNVAKEFGPLMPRDQNTIRLSQRRQITIPIGSPRQGRKPNQAVVEVLEGTLSPLPIMIESQQCCLEDEPHDDSDDDDDEPINPLVDALFDEVDSLRMQLYEAEMRCAIIEAETREEVMHEMEKRMRSMEARHSRRLTSELEQQELKTDAKIDILHQSGLFTSPLKRPTATLPDLLEEDQEEEDVERSLRESKSDDDNQSLPAERSPSPLAGKSKVGKSGKSTALTITADEHTSESDDPKDENDNDDEWAPAESKQVGSKPTGRRSSETATKVGQSGQPSKRGKGRVSRLEEEMNELSLRDNVGSDDSVIIVPVKNRPKESIDNGEADGDSDEVRPAGPKKKKR